MPSPSARSRRSNRFRPLSSVRLRRIALPKKNSTVILQMPPPQKDATKPSLNLDEILFILFRHKWKILFCTALGIAAAVNVYLHYQPLYESEAKLMLRYVVDRSAVDSLDSSPRRRAARTVTAWSTPRWRS